MIDTRIKVILLLLLLVSNRDSRAQSTGNPFSPDDEMMSVYQKAVAPVAKVIDTQSIAIKPAPKSVIKRVIPEDKVLTLVVPEVTYVPPVKEQQYIFSQSDYFLRGAAIHSEGKTVGMKFPSMIRDKKYILFKIVKPNIMLSGNRDSEEEYTGTYLIPTLWWNSNIADDTPTWEQLNYIKTNYKVN